MFGGIGVFSSGQGGRSLRALYCSLSECVAFIFESRPWWVDSSSTEQFLAQSRQQLSVSAAAGQKKVNGVLISYLSTSVFLHLHHCIGNWQEVEVMDGCCAGWSVRTWLVIVC